MIKGVPNYVTTVRKTTLSFFYAIPNSRFLADVMRFSLSAVCSYLVFLVIILMVCLKGYINEGDH